MFLTFWRTSTFSARPCCGLKISLALASATIQQCSFKNLVQVLRKSICAVLVVIVENFESYRIAHYHFQTVNSLESACR